ncbi:hypothetical protein CMV30_06590 [Nibricoccus aquaticus]|uniref:histidine kinase n=1 Tax=Nibricoccus aquaticus TaxID=2576891 RepID=A0A290Q573_9BACT|nr:ATP-binding protein [Nibricoccus aquaticus]ATC63644.1 hypothetical protein CMV30_06590 [Nibricoccus aquaticus]
MHPLLARQLRKFSPALAEDAGCRALLEAVSRAYADHEQDRRLIEQTLETASAELTETNEKLRRESEERMRSLSNYYQRTLEMQEGMTLCFHKTEKGFAHTLCRGRLATRLGWLPERVEGRLLGEFLDPIQAREMDAVYQRAWSGDQCSYEGTSVDGSLTFLAHLSPRLEKDVVCEVIFSGVEITVRKKMEHEMRAAKERAENADRAKTEFLAMMSHEIRTPLNAVLGFAQLLRESNLLPKEREWLKQISTSGESLRDIIGEILDYSKIEAGQLELYHEAIELRPWLTELLEMFQERAKQKNIRIQLEFAQDCPKTIATDATRLRQIFVNLVGNALKFTKEGSIVISADSDPSNDPKHPATLRFSVRDSGIGIPKDRHDRIFKVFSQADTSTTRSYGGTGLGLAITQRLVGALGGEIGFVSAAGEGSTFFFTIKAECSDCHTDDSPGSHRVLVIEDDPTNRLLMEELLCCLGCVVDFADDEKRALALVDGGKVFDAVLMDAQLFRGGQSTAALEIAGRLKNGPRPRFIAIATEGSVTPELDSRWGIDALLLRPVDVAALSAELALVGARSLQTSPHR